MADYTTELGSLGDYRKGGVHVINDDPRNYVFSNVFEVASKSAPFERGVRRQEPGVRDRDHARRRRRLALVHGGP